MVERLEIGKKYYLDIDSYEIAQPHDNGFYERVKSTNKIFRYEGNSCFEFDNEYVMNIPRWGRFFLTSTENIIMKFLSPVQEEEEEEVSIDINLQLLEELW